MYFVALADYMAQGRTEPTRVETVRPTNTVPSPSPRLSAARARDVSADDSSDDEDVDLATLAARIFERHGLARYDKVSQLELAHSRLQRIHHDATIVLECTRDLAFKHVHFHPRNDFI